MIASASSCWRARAEAALMRLALNGRPFYRERPICTTGQPPGHHNSVGGLFSAAHRRGLIEPIERQPSTRRQARGRHINVWRARSYEYPWCYPFALQRAATDQEGTHDQ